MPGPHMHPAPPMSALDKNRLRQQAIGVRLRMQFDELITAPVPEEWLDLLRQADERMGQCSTT